MVALVQPARRMVQAMRVNKAVYLTNLGRIEEAAARLDPLLRRDPQNKAALAARAEGYARSGEYAKAYDVLALFPNPPESLFWKAVSAYQMVEETTASLLFHQIRTEDLPLQTAYFQLAELGENALTSRALSSPPQMPHLGSPVLEQTWLSLAGRLELKNEQWDAAAGYYEELDGLAALNSRDRPLATLAHLVTGRYDLAQANLENAYRPTEALQSVQNALGTLQSFENGRTYDSSSLHHRFDIKQVNSRSRIWTEVQSVRQMNEGQDARIPVRGPQPPHEDPVALFFMAELDELSGRLPEAYAKYKFLHEAHGSLSAFLRMHDLAGESLTVPQRLQEMFDAPEQAQYYATQDMVSTGGLRQNGYLVYHGGGEAAIEVMAPQEGWYVMTLIANTVRADGRGESVTVDVSGEKAGQLYIAREGWDCYRHPVWLKEGANQVLIRTSAKDRTSPMGQKHAFYMMGILITDKAELQLEQL